MNTKPITFNSIKHKIEYADLRTITNLLCKRCRPATIFTFMAIVTRNPHLIPLLPMFDRLERVGEGEDEIWEYTPAFSYNDEIREMRKAILRVAK